MTLNPGNDRTFTLTEEMTWQVVDSVDDRIEQLTENIAATDLHTEAEIAGFRDSLIKLRAARRILDGE